MLFIGLLERKQFSLVSEQFQAEMQSLAEEGMPPYRVAAFLLPNQGR